MPCEPTSREIGHFWRGLIAKRQPAQHTPLAGERGNEVSVISQMTVGKDGYHRNTRSCWIPFCLMQTLDHLQFTLGHKHIKRCTGILAVSNTFFLRELVLTTTQMAETAGLSHSRVGSPLHQAT